MGIALQNEVKPKNLWSYNPLPTGCVLYLPLWVARLRGSRIKSVDPFGHSGPVTGTTLAAQGRVFDGTDDYFTVGAPGVLADMLLKTIIVWIYPTTWGESSSGRIIAKSALNATGWQFLIQDPDTLPASGDERLYYGHSWSLSTGTLATWVTPNGSLVLNTWYCVAVVYDMNLTTNDPVLYIDGVSQTVTETVAPAGTIVSDATTPDNLWVGARNNAGTPDREFVGTIGEIGVWDRLLSTSEVLYYTEKTKGRYK